MAFSFEDIMPTAVTAVIASAVGFYTARRKGRTDDKALASKSEIAFRRDVMARLESCETRHDECEKNLRETRQEMSNTWKEIANLKNQLDL